MLEFLSRHDSSVRDVALALREIVLEEAPAATEKVYVNHPSAIWFGFGPKMNDMFCYIATARTHVNLGFCRGASLLDSDHVLEGHGKVMRHVKFWSEGDLKRAFVRRYIRAALRQHQVTGMRLLTHPKRRQRIS